MHACRSTLEDPTPIEGNAIADFCRRWGIVRLELFGSALRDDFNPQSDYDFLYTLGNDVRLGLRLVSAADELSTMMKRPVDLVSRKAVERSRNPIRKHEILSNARVVYAG